MIAPIKVHSGLEIVITNGFGKVAPHLRKFYIDNFGRDTHSGVDMILSGKAYQSYGSELLTPISGTVVTVIQNDPFGKNGNLVRVVSDNKKLQIQHYHCSKIKVKQGDRVEAGQTIALMGNSGTVSPQPTLRKCFNGTHTHFMIWEKVGDDWVAVDPMKYIDINNIMFGNDTSANDDVPPLAWVLNTLNRDVNLLAKQIKEYV